MCPKQPFEAVVRKNGPAIWRVCRAVLGHPDADDAWSETFLSALNAYPRLKADANVEAWLVTIAHRKAVDMLRCRSRQAVPVPDIPAQPGPDHADSRDLDLTFSLSLLPDKQRYAVVYHYLAGLPYKEVAAIVGGGADAARRAAADGVASLRKTVRQTEGADR